MRVRDIMTTNLVCCKRDTPLRDVVRMMEERDCGAIPVVDSRASMLLEGIITDRDLACRPVRERKNPQEMTAGDCMTGHVVKVTPEMSLEDCCKIMAEDQIRRLPVVNEDGRCVGIITQADIALNAPDQVTADLLRAISLSS